MAAQSGAAGFHRLHRPQYAGSSRGASAGLPHGGFCLRPQRAAPCGAGPHMAAPASGCAGRRIRSQTARAAACGLPPPHSCGERRLRGAGLPARGFHGAFRPGGRCGPGRNAGRGSGRQGHLPCQQGIPGAGRRSCAPRVRPHWGRGSTCGFRAQCHFSVPCRARAGSGTAHSHSLRRAVSRLDTRGPERRYAGAGPQASQLEHGGQDHH